MKNMKNKQNKLILLTLMITAAFLISAVPIVNPQEPEPGVDPGEVELFLKPGDSITIDKTVTTPIIPPKPDIYFLCDTTGSMFSVIEQMKTDASTIMSHISAIQPNAWFGVGNYKDFPYDTYAFNHQQSLTSDTSAVQTAIDNWFAGGGADGPEAQFYALTEIANTPAIGWRSESTKIVVWFGDAPAHDPVPMAATGYTYDITEATVTSALQSSGVKIIAISSTTGAYVNGLDGDPLYLGGDYNSYYGIIEGGTPGQASRLSSATGGSYMLTPDVGDIDTAILESLEEVTTDVWWEIDECDEELNVDLTPEVYYDVAGGTTLNFLETIELDETAEAGTYNCVVTFYANSYPEEGAVIGTQTITVYVGKIVDLIAGQHIDVGEVHIWNTEDNLYVKYVTTDGWYLTGTHVHVCKYGGVDDPLMYFEPMTKSGNPKVGRFDYHMSHPFVQEYTYEIPWGEDWSETVVIAAHAEVVHITEDGVIDQDETAWAEGSGFPGRNWAMYIVYIDP
jgi:hypothetical protein